MLTEQQKDSLRKAGNRLHNLTDYHVAHHHVMQLQQYFFLKDSRPFIYIHSRVHLAILTWYAMLRKGNESKFRDGPLHLDTHDMVLFEELTGNHKTFFEGMLAGTILLELEKGDMETAFILGRTQENPGFDLAEDDTDPFYLPLQFEGRYVGVEVVDWGSNEVIYTPFITAPTGETQINVREAHKL